MLEIASLARIRAIVLAVNVLIVMFFLLFVFDFLFCFLCCALIIDPETLPFNFQNNKDILIML